VSRRRAKIPTEGIFIPVSFDNTVTNALVDEHGYDLAWEKGMFCPCINKDTGQADFNCTLCEGRGYLYYDKQCIKGIITSITASKAFREALVMGDWVLGKGALTVKAEDDVSFRDRITNHDSIIRYSHVFNYDTRYAAYTLPYPVIDVLTMRTTGTEFENPTDYTINATGQIVFTGTGSLPLDQDKVSVVFTCHPTWIVLDHMHTVRDVRDQENQSGNLVDLMRRAPKQMIMELEFLHGVSPE
jgi:hypothetical protein